MLSSTARNLYWMGRYIQRAENTARMLEATNRMALLSGSDREWRSVPSIYVRKERLEAISGQPPDLGGGFVGCPFAPRCPKVMERCGTDDPPQFHLAGPRMSNCWENEKDSTESSHRHEAAGGVK